MLNLNFLAAQLLKSKYFSHGSLLKAKLGANSSFMWKSFMASLPLIAEGHVGELEMTDKLEIGGINGSQSLPVLRFNP